VWRQPVGAAWSGFAIAAGRAVTMEQHGEEEWVTCYDPGSGRLLWKTESPGRYNTAIAGEGPRATPTISNGLVFTLGATGILRCLDLESGVERWSRDIKTDSGAKVPDFGFASSPLVLEGKVIVSAGGTAGKSLLAYAAADGELAWSAGSRPVNYSSPFLYTLAGRQQIVMFDSEAITAHDPSTGDVLWEHPWGKGMPHVSRPIPIGDNRVLFSSGYGVGSALLEIAPGADGRFAATEVWKTIRFQAKFSNPVERDGHVFGVSDGIFACLDLKDGTVRWKNGRYGHGQGLLVGKFYLQMTEDPGELVLLQPTPEAANELARFPVFDAKTWNPLALSGGLLLVRNDREAACIRLPLAK
jgi:outer membrane protein assembly factor BamB